MISYTRLCLPFILRKRLAQLRLGCLPIRIETDRYTRPIVHRDQRYCLQPNCDNNVSNLSDEAKHIENEYHFNRVAEVARAREQRSPKGQGLLRKEGPPTYAILSRNLVMSRFTHFLTGFHRAFNKSHPAF